MTIQRNESQKLNAFIGRWHTTGPIYENGVVIGQVNALDTYAWLPGNYAVIHHADSQMGDTKVHGIEIIGYDPALACFYCPFFDDQDSVGHETLREEESIWVWEGTDVMGVSKLVWNGGILSDRL